MAWDTLNRQGDRVINKILFEAKVESVQPSGLYYTNPPILNSLHVSRPNIHLSRPTTLNQQKPCWRVLTQYPILILSYANTIEGIHYLLHIDNLSVTYFKFKFDTNTD